MAAAVDAGEGAAGALEQVCTLAQSAGGSRAVGDIVQQALNAKRVFVFGELLAEPNVRALRSTDQANQLRLLEIFAYGTYSDYKREASQLPPLTPPQKTKLRQLSLVSLARKASVVPYDAIGEALEVDVSQGTGLTPASLRAGGATSHFEFFEDIPKLQRRARWADPRSAEVYVQEVAPYEYLASLDPRTREEFFRVAEFFEDQVHEALAA